jgi:bacteriorhodopsin
MADIDIVPKRRSSIWLWVVLAVIVIAAIVWLMAATSGTAPGAGASPQGYAPAGAETARALLAS